MLYPHWGLVQCCVFLVYQCLKCLIARLKCLYTNAHNMGKKQEDVKTIVQLENHDMIATTEVWWDGSHNCYTGTEGYKLFRKDGQGRSVRAPLYVMEGIDSKEMLLRNSHGWVDKLCVIVKGWINNGHLEVGVYYRSPD